MTERRAACVCLFEQLRKIGQTLIASVERWGEIQVGRLDQGETKVKVGGREAALKSESPGKMKLRKFWLRFYRGNVK